MLKAAYITNICNQRGFSSAWIKEVAIELGYNPKLSHNTIEELDKFYSVVKCRIGIKKR